MIESEEVCGVHASQSSTYALTEMYTPNWDVFCEY